MCLRIKILRSGTNAIFCAACRYHHFFLSAMFSLRCTKRGYPASQAGQDRGNRTSPVTTTNLNELKININVQRATKSILFTWQHIQERQHESHFKVHYMSLQTEEALCGEHSTSTPPPSLHILSGFKKLIIDNNFLKIASQYIYSNKGRPYTPSWLSWHQAKQGSEAICNNSAEANYDNAHIL